MTVASDPLPDWSSTFTQNSFAAGATPTTSMVLSRAPTIPATCVPCPASSWQLDPNALNAFTAPAEILMRQIDAGVENGHTDAGAVRR